MQMQCKAVLCLSTRIVWDVNLVRKLHYIRGTRRGPRYRESSNRGHNARASGRGRADKIQTARASGAANCCCIGRVDGIREDGWARGLVLSASLVSSRLVSRVREYTAIPKYSGVVIFSGHTRPTTGRARTCARAIYTGNLLNSANGQPGAEF